MGKESDFIRPKMKWDAADQQKAFQTFKEASTMYMITRDVKKKDMHAHIYMLLGERGKPLWDTMTKVVDQATRESDDGAEAIWTELEKNFAASTSFWTYREELYSGLKQGPEESITHLDNRILNILNECSYTNDEIKSRRVEAFLQAVKYFEVKKFIREQKQDVDFNLILDKAKTHERTLADYKSYTGKDGAASSAHTLSSSMTVDAMKGNKNRRREETRQHRGRSQRRQDSKTCSRCGTSHKPRNCPAWGKTCRICKGKNHFHQMCRSGNNSRSPGQGRRRSGSREHRDRSYSQSPAPRDRSRGQRGQGRRRNGGDTHQADSVMASCPREAGHLYAVETVGLRASQRCFGVHTIPTDVDKDSKTEMITDLQIKLPGHNREVDFEVKVDTGAEMCIMPTRVFRDLLPSQCDRYGVPQNLTQPEYNLQSYSNVRLKQHGTIIIPVKHLTTGRMMDIKWHVVDTPNQAICGHAAATRLGLVSFRCVNKARRRVMAVSTDEKRGRHQNQSSHEKRHRSSAPDRWKRESNRPSRQRDRVKREDVERATYEENSIQDINDLKRRYPLTFDRIGNFKGKYHIHVDKDVQPKQHSRREVPLEKREAIEKELKEMVRLGIITPQEEPTPWVSSLTYPTKANGKLRICLDPKDLNRAILRENHKAPTMTEITHKLAGAKVFSKLDAQKGFWSVHLDHESSLLTTFNTHLGRFRFLRMPFGLKMSQDVFQMRMDQIVEQCPGVIAIHDDICVYGRTEAEHDAHLWNLMKVAERSGLVFNSDKCEIKNSRISFYGKFFTPNGVEPDPAKVQGIVDMPAPTNAKELQSFLGMVNFMQPHVPHLSHHSAPLRELLKSDKKFYWDAQCNAAFQQLKAMIKKKQALQFYDRTKPVIVQADASQYGLGAALLQEGLPVAFASKSLSDTETRYANIEREMLSVVFACERFHTYLTGRSFIVENDHKPLEMIQLKNLKAAPPRLQRMLLRLQEYDAKIIYKPGPEMSLPDALSRLPGKDNSHITLDLRVDFINFSSRRIDQVAEETKRDPILSTVYQLTHQGWPDEHRRCPKIARRYWDFRDELTVEHGILMKGERVVIPESLQVKFLADIHEGHPGTTKCLSEAKMTVYWDSMTADIKDMCERCPACQKHKPFNRYEPMQASLPNNPWEQIGADFFDHEGQKYLLISDYFSKFPFVFKMGKTDAKAVIRCLEEIISLEGVPDRLRTDNGPPFNSDEFSAFCQQEGIEHILSSPLYPESNGFIERHVKNLKDKMRKVTEDGKPLTVAVKTIRATSIGPNMPTPAEILHGRPMTNVTKERGKVDLKAVRNYLWDRAHQSAANHDRRHRAKKLEDLTEGQLVYFRHQRPGKSPTWEEGIITKAGSEKEPRSYWVIATEDSKLRMRESVRRNRRDLQIRGPTKEARKPDRSKKSKDTNPKEQHKNIRKEVPKKKKTVRWHDGPPLEIPIFWDLSDEAQLGAQPPAPPAAAPIPPPAPPVPVAAAPPVATPPVTTAAADPTVVVTTAAAAVQPTVQPTTSTAPSKAVTFKTVVNDGAVAGPSTAGDNDSEKSQDENQLSEFKDIVQQLSDLTSSAYSDAESTTPKQKKKLEPRSVRNAKSPVAKKHDNQQSESSPEDPPVVPAARRRLGSDKLLAASASPTIMAEPRKLRGRTSTAPVTNKPQAVKHQRKVTPTPRLVQQRPESPLSSEEQEAARNAFQRGKRKISESETEMRSSSRKIKAKKCPCDC